MALCFSSYPKLREGGTQIYKHLNKFNVHSIIYGNEITTHLQRISVLHPTQTYWHHPNRYTNNTLITLTYQNTSQ